MYCLEYVHYCGIMWGMMRRLDVWKPIWTNTHVIHRHDLNWESKYNLTYFEGHGHKILKMIRTVLYLLILSKDSQVVCQGKEEEAHLAFTAQLNPHYQNWPLF